MNSGAPKFLQIGETSSWNVRPIRTCHSCCRGFVRRRFPQVFVIDVRYHCLFVIRVAAILFVIVFFRASPLTANDSEIKP